MIYFSKENTDLPTIKYPLFMVGMNLSITAKLVYALLFDRAADRKTAETDGKIYVTFTIKDLSECIGKSEMTVKNSLKILEEKGLIKRKSKGVGKPTHIFILYPNDEKTK